MNYATVHKKARTGKMEVSQAAYKKAIVTLDEAFQWPKDPEWCKLDQEQGKLGQKQAGRKMKGWRIRAPEGERVQLKEVNDQLQARMEAEHKKQ
jgi:hypothetical protein